MENTETLPDFITSYFIYAGKHHKMIALPEMLTSPSGLDFTGNFTGINIVEGNGTVTFTSDEHPNNYWVCDKQPIENAPPEFPYNFLFKSFNYDGHSYKVALSHDLSTWEEADGLVTTGCFEGVMIGSNTGTVLFTLMPPNEFGGWNIDCQRIEPAINEGLVEKLAEIANEIKETSPVLEPLPWYQATPENSNSL